MNRNDDAYAVTPKKSLGQHFLTSDIVPRWMCDAANLTPGDTVLEIGPGTGVLTAELLKRQVTVHAIETDDRSLDFLKTQFSAAITSGKLILHKHDMRDPLPTDLFDQSTSYKVVANIPYYLSGQLLRTFLETSTQPSVIVFLIQKELAERIARAKKSSLLQLSVQAFGTPRYVKTVTAGHFHPPPKVTSAILAISDITHNRVPTTLTKHFFTVLHAGFAHKRKFSLSNLARHWSRPIVQDLFQTHGIALQARPEDITLQQWIQLSQSLPMQ